MIGVAGDGIRRRQRQHIEDRPIVIRCGLEGIDVTLAHYTTVVRHEGSEAAQCLAVGVRDGTTFQPVSLRSPAR